MTRFPRSLAGAALLIAIAGGLAVVAFRPAPVPVDLHTVARAPMRVTINADGRTRIREIYEIASPIFGTARRAPVHVGDPVRAGETVVAVVEPVAPALLDARSRSQSEAAVREAEAARHVAESELHRAEEERAFARSQFERAQALVERGAASITRLEEASQRQGVAEATVEAALSRLDMAQGALDRARAALIEVEDGVPGSQGCCVRVTAPADGVVLDLAVESERAVIAGQSLLSVGDPADLEIVADLLSVDAVRIGPGARAVVERWGGPMPLEARLRSVEPAARTEVSALGIEEQRVDAVFDIVSPTEARAGLGHGFSVFLRIVEWEAEDVLQVPLSAMFRDGERWAVYVAEGGTVRLRPVAVGRRNEDAAEILDGLAPGARVVVHPNDALGEGTRIVERASLRG